MYYSNICFINHGICYATTSFASSTKARNDNSAISFFFFATKARKMTVINSFYFIQKKKKEKRKNREKIKQYRYSNLNKILVQNQIKIAITEVE